jgi:DNA polymerase-1
VCVRAPEFEADDIIATLSKRAREAGRQEVACSRATPISCNSRRSRARYQFGKPPEAKFVARRCSGSGEVRDPSAGHLALYKALVGEPGDGLPGVPGIGPVKARKLLALAQNPGDIAKLLKGEVEVEAFRLALKLATLRDDVPLDPIPGSECRVRTARAIA